MKKRTCLRIGFTCFFLLFSASVSTRSYFTEEEAFEKAFPEGTKIEKRVVFVFDEQRERIKSLANVKSVSGTFTYYEGIREGETIGYAVIKNVLGKLSHITFMVILDPEGEIDMVEILASQGLWGADIRQKRFLDQFKKKTINDPLRLKSDIDAITGATISSRALTEGIKEILGYLSVLLQLETVAEPNCSKQKKE